MPATVLIADDSQFMRTLMKRILSEQFDVLDPTATNGNEVVELYREFAPDVVIMEIALPQRNGLKATADLIDIDSDARVVVCSHVTAKEPREMAQKVGVRAYITKPFDKRNLMDTIRSAVTTGA